MREIMILKSIIGIVLLAVAAFGLWSLIEDSFKQEGYYDENNINN